MENEVIVERREIPVSKIERIKEFDVARSIAIIFMIIVHVEFAIYNYNLPWFATIFDYLGSPFVAPTMMFILGANVFLSTRNSPKPLMVRGLYLFGISWLFNIVCHSIPFFIVDAVNHTTIYQSDALHWIFASDILNFSGLSFMLFALVKRFKIKNWILALIGVAASFINIILTRYCPINFDEHVILAAVTGLFYTSSITGYFSFLAWIIFPIAGYIFIQILTKIKNRNRFYLILIASCLSIYLICIFISYMWFPDLPFVEYKEEYSYYQMHPFNALGNLAFVLAWLGIMYFLCKIIPHIFDNIIEFSNRHLSAIYIMQWFVINYFLIIPGNGNLKVNEWQFLLIAIGVIIASNLIVYLFSKYKKWAYKPIKIKTIS